MALVTDKEKHNMIQQMLLYGMVTDKEIHIDSSIYKNRINNFLSRKVMNLLDRNMVVTIR